MADSTFKNPRTADRPRGHTGTSESERLIFAATERLLGRMSLNDISVARIIDEAGVSRATFYFYFSSKFAVIAALLAAVMDEIVESVRPFLERDESTPPDVSLRESFDAGTTVWAEHRLLLRAVSEHWHAVPELRELWNELWGRSIDLTAELLDRERKRGLAPPGPDSRQLSAALLWGAERAIYVAGLDSNDELPGEKAIVESLVTIWHGAIYGTAPPPVKKPKRRRT